MIETAEMAEVAGVAAAEVAEVEFSTFKRQRLDSNLLIPILPSRFAQTNGHGPRHETA